MARQLLVQICFLLPIGLAQDCVITTRNVENEIVIVRDCPTTMVIITCDANLGNCREITFTKTVTSTTSASSTSSSTATTRTTSSSTATQTTSTSSTFSQTATSITASVTHTSTTLTTTTETSTTASSTTETTTLTSVTTSSLGVPIDVDSMVVVEAMVSFARQGVDQTAAEVAVISSLSRALGLPAAQIMARAEPSAAERRRLSDLWTVNLEILVLPEEELEVREKLAGLQNSQDFAQRLREELRLQGAEPIEDLNVNLDVVPVNQEKPAEEDISLIIIVAVVAAVLVMLGAVLWKVCSGLSARDQLLQDTRHHEDTVPPLTDTSTVPPLMPSSVGNPSGRARSGEGEYVVPLEQPPVPPADFPPENLWSEASATLEPVRLSDVHPEVASKRPSVASQESAFLDQAINETVCRALSPSVWTSRLMWSELPMEQVPVSKDYQLSFQRGKVVGHCLDGSSQSKITGRYQKSGEMVWREVPQFAATMATECQGRLRICPGGRGDCFEIVGLFTVVSTSISARPLGSGRFTLSAAASLQPTAFGNHQVADDV